MIQLCAACKTSQILDLAQKGELPGHSTAPNIIANFSFANIPSQSLIIYSNKGPSISYLESSYYTIEQEMKAYIVNNYKEHHDRLKYAGYKWLGLFLVYFIFTIIMLIVVPIFGAILFVILIFTPFCLMCYQKKIYDDYNAVLLPGLINYCQNTLLPRYSSGHNISIHMLYPVKWNTSMGDCNCVCGPNLEWITIRFTLGNIENPIGGPIYWSNTGQQTYAPPQGQSYNNVNYQTGYNNMNSTYNTQPTAPMMRNSMMQQHVVPMPVPEHQQLPPGWRQAVNNEGRTYYINDNTQTTQWEYPQLYTQQQV